MFDPHSEVAASSLSQRIERGRGAREGPEEPEKWAEGPEEPENVLAHNVVHMK